jgi:hypothetical protein
MVAVMTRSSVTAAVGHFRTSRSDCRSLWQSRFSRALFESSDVFGSAIREHLPEIGNPKCRIDLAQARDGLVRLIELPGEGIAGRSHPRGASRIWLLQEALLRPRLASS